MITQQLQRDDVQQPLETVHARRDPDRPRVLVDARVVLVADDDRLPLPGRHL